MALHYQTECRIGARRINRSYSGYQAFVAIVFDLIFGLLFELVASTVGLAVRLVALLVPARVPRLEELVEGAGRGDGGPGLHVDPSVRDLASCDRPAGTGEPGSGGASDLPIRSGSLIGR